MLALLDSLLVRGFDLEDQGRRAVSWMTGADYKVGQLFDIGPITKAALNALRAGATPQDSGLASERDNGNGSLMRILPIALVGRDLPAAVLVQQARKSSSITHAHPLATMTCALYVLTARELLVGTESKDAALSRASAELDSLIAGRDQDAFGRIQAFDRVRGRGFVLDTFWAAWHAFRNSANYADCVIAAVRLGYDTDTTASVAGGLAGIYWGIEGIPARWRSGLRGAEIVRPLVEVLTSGLGAPST